MVWSGGGEKPEAEQADRDPDDLAEAVRGEAEEEPFPRERADQDADGGDPDREGEREECRPAAPEVDRGPGEVHEDPGRGGGRHESGRGEAEGGERRRAQPSLVPRDPAEEAGEEPEDGDESP